MTQSEISSTLLYRSKFLLEVLSEHAQKDNSILEIGEGDKRNTNFLREHGYTNVTGIDELDGTAIEDVPETEYDVVYTMSCLFLIKDESVFPKIARMAKKYLITIEGETTKGLVIGRDYGQIFTKLGFTQVRHITNVFNEFGVLRVFKKV